MCLFHNVFFIMGHNKKSLKATEVVIFFYYFSLHSYYIGYD